MPSNTPLPRRPSFGDVGGVAFDLFGTLTDGSLERTRSGLYRQLAGMLHVSEEAFVAVMRQTFAARTIGEYGNSRQTLIRLCSLLGAEVDEDAIEAGVQFRLEIERRLTRPREDAVPVLRELCNRGLAVCVVSDCGPETREIWHDLPFSKFVDRPVLSCDVGERKPHLVLYQLAAARMGIALDKCLYVGDGGSRELTGARAAGMHPVRLAVQGEKWAGMRYDPDNDFFGASVASLSELLSGS